MRRLLPLAILVLVLSSCVPFARFATDTLNQQAGDDATLTLVVTPPVGVNFDPGSATALGVLVNVIGDPLTAYDEALCHPVTYGVDCTLGDVTAPVLITVSGSNVTATATYRRAGASRVYHEIAVAP